MQAIRIGDRRLGEGEPVFVVAEAGINHNGSLELALRLIDAAAEAGCDAVKFQKRSPRALLSRSAYERPYVNGGHSYGRTYGEHRERLELPAEHYEALRSHARARGLEFMASAWDAESAEFLDRLGVPAHKIGSPDLTNVPLCRQVAASGKPVLLSTGMSEPWEIDETVRAVLAVNPELVLLHCVSIYPAPHAELRLGNLAELRARYGVPVGYSGHEAGWHAVLGAVALGARVVEKHITLDRTMRGGDHHFSLEPDELRAMVAQIRELEEALGRGGRRLLPEELPFRRKLGKSITTRVPVDKGTRLTSDMLTVKCPATGYSPQWLERLIGRPVVRDIAADQVIESEDVAL